MLSRHADACYWIGRYVERAEATARMVDVHYHAALESMGPSGEVLGDGETDESRLMRWQSLLAISGTAEAYYKRYTGEADHDVLQFFAFDRQNPHSILSVWRSARDNARSIRELIASEMWESMNVSYLQLLEWNVDRVLAGSPHEFFQMVKNASHLFQGILNRTMMMSETRDWLDTGRFLERAGQTARLLDVKYHDLLPVELNSTPDQNGGIVGRAPAPGAQPVPVATNPYGVGGPLDTHGWIAVLRSVSAFEMYRKTHQGGIRPARVVDFLVLNPQFPASVRHCVGRVEGCLRRISGNQKDEPVNEPERMIGRLRADLTYTPPEEIILSGLHEFLQSVQVRCEEIGNSVTRAYLSY